MTVETYQWFVRNAGKISDAYTMVICDEAHRTTGVTLAGEDASNFVRIHDPNYIHATRRLYMTATPRIYSDTVKDKAPDGKAAPGPTSQAPGAPGAPSAGAKGAPGQPDPAAAEQPPEDYQLTRALGRKTSFKSFAVGRVEQREPQRHGESEPAHGRHSLSFSAASIRGPLVTSR